MKRVGLAIAVLLAIAAYLAGGLFIVFGSGQLGYHAAVAMGASAELEAPSTSGLMGFMAAVLALLFWVFAPVVCSAVAHGLPPFDLSIGGECNREPPEL